MAIIHTEKCSWSEFEKAAFEKYQPAMKARGFVSEQLFRGHQDSKWELETTLERYFKVRGINRQVTWREYNRYLKLAHPFVSSMFGKKYEPIDEDDDTVTGEDNKFKDFFKSPPNYEFMVHLRHHGFELVLGFQTAR